MCEKIIPLEIIVLLEFLSYTKKNVPRLPAKLEKTKFF
jgi:hypothetical protein